MREIKFRAWDKTSDTMIIKPTMVIDSGELIEKKCIIMQYTGLKDKNGKEIYEGDIVVINPDDDSYRDVVVRDKNWLELRSYKNKCVSGCSLYDYHDQIEIIGNIYENPELIQNV